MTDVFDRLTKALADRYTIERACADWSLDPNWRPLGLRTPLFSILGSLTMHRLLPSTALLIFTASAGLDGQELQFAEMGDCQLENGDVIEDCRIGYRSVGSLSADRSNAVLFPTWFGGTSEQILSLLGPDGMVDPAKSFVIVVDAFGNGVSSSPSNSTAQSGAAFPSITIRDMVRHQHRLLTEYLGVSRLNAVLGISMGGMQAFEWAVSYPEFAEKIVPVVGSPRLAVYDIVLWEMELRILDWFLDCRCQPPAALREGLYFLMGGPDYQSRVLPRDSLPSARARLEMASLTEERVYDLSSQLHAMIGHDVAAPFAGSLEQAASLVQAEAFIVVGLADHLVTPGPALEFAGLLGARTLRLTNDCGHQAPWCEPERFNSAVREFLRK
jgi:homoserine O-acetyltransferase